jgi:hypothetical protein
MAQNLSETPPKRAKGEDAWLDQALRVHREAHWMAQLSVEPGPVSEGFARRCRDAARVARDIRALGTEHQRVGFVPLPLAQYLRELAQLAGIPLPPLLGWARASEPPRPAEEEDSIGRWARLAREIGLDAHQAWLHARIGLAERLGLVSGATLYVRCRSAEVEQLSPMAECRDILREIELEYDPERRDELERLRAQVHAAFWPATGATARGSSEPK